MTYRNSTVTREFTAYSEADLLQGKNGGSIDCGDRFTMPAGATLCIAVTDDDKYLSGDCRDNANDSKQHAQITDALTGDEVGNGRQIYAEVYHVLKGSDGKIYYMIEIEQERGDAPGQGDDYFAFYGDVPPAGTELKVVKTCDVNSDCMIKYSELDSGPKIEPEPQQPVECAPVTIEAEDMMMSGGYKVACGDQASEGKFAMLACGSSGALKSSFAGATGAYDITVWAQDETDGVSKIKVYVDGAHVGTIMLDQQTDGGGSNNSGFTAFTLQGIEIPAGAEITLQAWKDCGEYVRIDKIDFTPVCEPEEPGNPPATNSCSFTIEGGVDVKVTLTELADGSLSITYDVLDTSGQIGDLRGAFIDLPSNSLTNGLTVTGDLVTAQQIQADGVDNLGGGNNVKGDVTGTYGKFDLGVSFGSAGIGSDDVRSATIVLSSDAGPLKASDFSGLDFAVRLTSVGTEGGSRGDSLKLGATAPALECGCDCVACDDPSAVKIDFEGLAAGDSPTAFYEGVTITAQRFKSNTAQDDAMVFDSNNPTGGDTDLRTSGQNNILIVSEDNDAGDPDDAIGGKITFEFDTPAQILSMVVIDTEEGGTIEAFDANGISLGSFAIPKIADGALSTVTMNVTGVARLDVTLNGSGAIDDLCYIPGEENQQPQTAGLGDYVWRDMDCDGVQDADEAGLNGVTVNLLDTSGNIVATTVTDTNASTGLDGFYEFTDLDAGDYIVEFVNTSGNDDLKFVRPDQGTDDALDSDAGADGRTGVITLAAGEFDDTIDAGLVLCYEVPDTADQLLGIAGSEFRSNADRVSFDNNGSVQYSFNAATGALAIDLNVNQPGVDAGGNPVLPWTGLSVPTQTTTITNPFTGQTQTITTTKAAVSIDATLDSTGAIVDGTDGFLFFEDLNDNDTLDGGETVLLTGHLSAFGGDGSGASTDSYELIVEITGGTLAGEVDTKFLGLALSSEFSNFTGDFDTSFSGEGKGDMFGLAVDCICG